MTCGHLSGKKPEKAADLEQGHDACLPRRGAGTAGRRGTRASHDATCISTLARPRPLPSLVPIAPARRTDVPDKTRHKATGSDAPRGLPMKLRESKSERSSSLCTLVRIICAAARKSPMWAGRQSSGDGPVAVEAAHCCRCCARAMWLSGIESPRWGGPKCSRWQS
jgi:hypothetical protein